jgi:DNA-binding transcriptional ArsR family regulator
MKAKVETWLEQIRIGAVKSNITRVLKYVQDSGIAGTSIYEMRDALGMSHQTLTATISQIADEGLVFEAGQFQINSSWYTIYMYVANENARKEIAHKRKQEKFRQWIERGLSEYDDLMSVDTMKALKSEENMDLSYIGI